MVQEQPSRKISRLAAIKLKVGRWPELYFSSEQFPLDLRGTNGKNPELKHV